MMPGRIRPSALIALAALFAVLLSACASVPTTGPVLTGQAVERDAQPGYVQYNPLGPQAGASAEQVVSGFLTAAAGFGNDHQVARSFLTVRRRQLWSPDASVAIYRVTPTVKETTEKAVNAVLPSAADDSESGHRQNVAVTTKVTVRAPVIADVDGFGRYRLAPPGQIGTWDFTLTRVPGGDWRIDSLSDGILLSGYDFSVTFQSFPVYFLDPSGQYLVPDLHWYPLADGGLRSPELPTALTRTLLAGPPDSLQGAVTTAAPNGTRLRVGAVVVSDKNVATVDLTDQVNTAGTRGRQQLLSQLTATLRQLAPIESVQITVKGVALDIPPGAPQSTDPTQRPVQPTVAGGVVGGPVVIDAKGRLARLVGANAVPVKQVGALNVPGVNRPAVALDGSAYAVLTADRGKLLVQLPGAKRASTVVTAAGLSAPSFDPRNWVWTAAQNNQGSVFATQPGAGAGAAALRVKAPWLKRDQVVAMRMSRDGTRALLAVRYRGRAHVFVSAVLRDGDGRPQSLAPPIALVPDLRTVRDVAWVDADHVVVLGQRGSDLTDLPWVAQIGGLIDDDPMTAAPGAEMITAGTGDQTMMVGTASGTLERSAAVWDKVSTARWPAFPG